MKLSVIVPTLNRLPDLIRCINSLRENEPLCTHEIIVIDGGSTDGTAGWLVEQRDLLVVQHNRRRGCTMAFNHGFAVASGRYCAQLSDDVVIENDCLDAAIDMVENDKRIGQVLIAHVEPTSDKPAQPRFTTNIGSFPFVPFGVTPKWLGDQVGWWGDYYHLYGDAELSLKVMNEGYKIKTLPDKYVMHYPGASNLRGYAPDRILFDQRWSEWEAPEGVFDD